MSTKQQFVPGLEGVIAAETAISFLDTEQEKSLFGVMI
jgi:citrate synthase